MTKKSPLLIFILFLIVACKKNSPDTSSNYFQFQMDNTTYSFDNTSAWIDTTSGASITSIYAANTKTKSFVTIELQSNNKRLESIYSHLNPQPTNSILVVFTTLLISGQYAYSYPVEGGLFLFTIDKANNNSLQGTFTGALSPPISSQNGTLTEGKFSIPFQFR